MERGEVRQELNTTRPEQPTQPFLEEAIAQLVNDLGVDREALTKLKVLVTYQQLSSRHNPDIESNDLLSILWYNDEPVAISLETRNERQMVVTQTVYFGPRQVDGI